MQKFALSLLCFGILTISASAKECELIITPSDFQLTNQLKAPNESYAFSAIGNFIYIANFRGYAQAILCGGLEDGDVEKKRACMDELSHFIEIDSAKSNGSRLSDIIGLNAADGFKTSGKSPISKKHLCDIQNKYKTKASRSRVYLLPLLEARQEQMRKDYLEASETAGQSSDMNEIQDSIMRVWNKQ
jgi:hypothetical protein